MNRHDIPNDDISFEYSSIIQQQYKYSVMKFI